MIFVDTNYFLRFLLDDIGGQHQTALELFSHGARGKLKLFTSTIVMFEIFWVLMTSYDKSKTELIGILDNILQMRFIRLDEREILRQALQVYGKTTLELEDCYNLEYAKSKKMIGFKSFDKKLMKLAK